jgi:hypothetical protein
MTKVLVYFGTGFKIYERRAGQSYGIKYITIEGRTTRLPAKVANPGIDLFGILRKENRARIQGSKRVSSVRRRDELRSDQ